MKLVFLLNCIFILTSCSGQVNKEAPEKDIGNEHKTDDKNSIRHDVRKIRGTVRFSWEISEIDHQNERYFLSDKKGIVMKIAKNSNYAGKAYIKLENVCVEGYVLTKSDNQGKGFGPNGRYGKAFVVTASCYI